MDRDHLHAVLEAYIVTFLWSSSYVLVKVGLAKLSPLTLVSIRYLISSSILVPIAFFKGESRLLKNIKTFLKLLILGFSGYTIAQGLQCLGLFYLPAVSVTFILNFTPVLVVIFGALVLKEYPKRLQLIGMVLVLAGAYTFFYTSMSFTSWYGAVLTLISGIGWAIYLVLGRLFFVREKTSLLGMTAFSMGFGTIILTASNFFLEGMPLISPSSLTIIIILGVSNTALAFFLWNHALQRLRSFEISIIQNTMLVQIAVLAWVFLGEGLTYVKVISMVMVFFGALVVQLKR